MRLPGETLNVPANPIALIEEPEVALVYVNDEDGNPHYAGYTFGNDLCDIGLHRKDPGYNPYCKLCDTALTLAVPRRAAAHGHRAGHHHPGRGHRLGGASTAATTRCTSGSGTWRRICSRSPRCGGRGWSTTCSWGPTRRASTTGSGSPTATGSPST
ncbi:hypothetical protein ACFQ60_06330 [Streptomyces zhihengii]